ncbi:MAG TPA: PKD domain-containing protein [Planctomycetota bacterium]|nr:PKD domain-containing protein [Planctomycetota bacterium]
MVLLAATLTMPLAMYAAEPTKIIWDTDIGDDCDDAGCLALIHALADRGEIEILAVMISNKAKYAAACADAINTYYGRPNIPVGDMKANTSTNGNDRYATYIATNYPQDLGEDVNVPDAVKVYREVLSKQPDGSVVIITVGSPSNVSSLLNSGPDAISPLTGVELVAKKVKFYSSGGNGNSTLPNGLAGFNYRCDVTAAANELEKWPASVPMIEGGGSGRTTYCGAGYETKPANHIIRKCYERFHNRTTKLDRPCWDQMRLLFGVRERSNFNIAPMGNITITPDAIMTYHATPNRNRSYAYVIDKPLIQATIEELMMHDPGDYPLKPAPAVPPAGIRINFQPAGAAVPAGFLPDLGTVYGNRGNGFFYGWDRFVGNDARERGLHADQTYDTHCAVPPGRSWKLRVANGQYDVRFVMGDPQFADNTNNIYVQDKLLSDTDGHDHFDEFVTTVNVTNETLVLRQAANTGGNATICFLELSPKPSVGKGVSVNFQPATSERVSGMLVDSGAAFAARGNGHSYGWDIDIAADMRDRGVHADQRYDTFAHMQKLGNRSWKINLENGSYQVRVVMGDARYQDQTSNIYVQETYLADPDGIDNFDEYTVTTTVSTGSLVIRPAANSNAGAKLCFVEIVPVNTAPTIVSPASATPAPVAVGAEVSFSASATDEESASLTYTWDFGDGTSGSGSSVTKTYITAGTYTATVTVSDGALSTTSSVVVSVNGLTVNFQPAATPLVASTQPDHGAAFGARGNNYSYGWDIDISADMRDRSAHPDQRYDTFAHMQKLGARTWTIGLPNGEYRLRIVMGDSRYSDQTNNIIVQGVAVADPDGIDNFDEFTVTTSVVNGKLEIKAGTNLRAGAKLCFVEIARLPARAPAPDQNF